MKLLRKTVSAPFRALVAELYPGLADNRAYWGFFGYLLFGAFFDKDTERLVISQDLLADIEGKPVNRYRGIDFLEAFRRDVLTPGDFEWTEWFWSHEASGKCRQVKKLVLHEKLEEALAAERLKLHHNAGRVYFVDGSAFSRAKQAAERKSNRGEAIQQLQATDCDWAREILDYLNRLPPNLFSKLLKDNLPGALAVAASIQDQDVRDTQLRILGAIVDHPQPYYAPSYKNRTVRIFGVGECIVSLKKEVRHALTRGASETDLANCQLAIVARLWKISIIEEFLASGKSFWVHLCEQLGYSADDKGWLKDAFKEPLYAACFGMPKPNVQGFLTENLKAKNIENGGARVLKSPLMSALFEARGGMVEKIQADGGGLTCFGKWIDLSDSVDVDSILAQQAQAMELKLLYPLIKLARTTHDFTVILWQHDGVTIHFQRRRDYWERRITEDVQREIEAAGIQTMLEWKHDIGMESIPEVRTLQSYSYTIKKRNTIYTHTLPYSILISTPPGGRKEG